VECNFKGIWLIGRIKKVRRDGTFDVDYEDGEVDKKIGSEFIRKTTKSKADSILASVEEKMTEENLDKKIADLIASRGKKNTNVKEVLRQLEVLSKASRYFGIKKEIPVLMHLISSMFDSQRNIDDYMELLQWRTCHRSLTRIVKLLETNKKIVLNTLQGEEASDLVIGANQLKNGINRKEDETAGFEEVKSSTDEKLVNNNLIILKVVGSIETFVLRLQDEYTKSLQQLNPHTQVINFVFCYYLFFVCVNIF
jgi:translation initiation factor 3 subunit C